MRLHSCGTSRVVIVVIVVAAPAITDSAIVSVIVVVVEHSVNGRHDHCRRTHYQYLGRSYKRQPRTSVAVSLLKCPSDVAKSMAHVDCTATSWVDIDVDGTVEGNYTAGSSCWGGESRRNQTEGWRDMGGYTPYHGTGKDQRENARKKLQKAKKKAAAEAANLSAAAEAANLPRSPFDAGAVHPSSPRSSLLKRKPRPRLRTFLLRPRLRTFHAPPLTPELFPPSPRISATVVIHPCLKPS